MIESVIFDSYSRANLQLLALLQEDVVQSTAELAKKTGLSANSIRKKYKTFKSDGVILNEIAVLNSSKVGNFLYFMADVKLANNRKVALETITALALDNPMVIQCFHTTGAWDFRLLIVARTLPEFEKFAQKQFTENAGVDQYEFNLVIRPIKLGFSLPLL